MEAILGFENLQCPEDEEIFTDLAHQGLSDETLISGF